MSKTIQWIIDNILPLIAGILLAIGVDENLIGEGKDLILQIIGLIAAIVSFVKNWKKPEEAEKVADIVIARINAKK